MSGGFSFGSTPVASGAPTGQTSGTTFGFGTAAGSGFGQSATTSAPPNFSLGSSTLPAFGATQAATSAAPNFSLGTSTLPAFGSTQPSAPTGLSFGTPAQPVSSGFGFGGTPATSANTGLTFNTPATSASGLTFNFASGTSTVGTTPSLGLSFGASTSQPGGSTTGFNLTGPSTTAAPAFGGFSTNTSQATGFGLGGTTTGLGATTGIGTSGTLNFASGGCLATSTGSSGFGSLGTAKPPATTAAASTFVGLGGVDTTFSAATTSTGTLAESTAEKVVRDNVVPNELMQAVEEFKTFVKNQKLLSSEFSRTSTKPMHKVETEIATLSKQLDGLKSQITCLSITAQKLHRESTKTLQHAEMAQQTQDTPLGLQMENLAPDEYFAEMTTKMEQELITFKSEVENMQRLLTFMAESPSMNKDDVMQAVRRMHEIFVALACRLHTQHSAMEQLKEQCLNMRRKYLHDETDIFCELQPGSANKPLAKLPVNKNLAGPPLFSSLENTLSPSNYATSIHQPQQPHPPSRPLTLGLGQNTSVLGTSTFGGGSSEGTAVENRPFQLQQPPVGNKRGKR